MTDKAPVVIDYDSPKIIQTIKSTIAKDATDEELALFLEHCKATQLNPFKREIWFIKTKPKKDQYGNERPPEVQIMTGINGFYTIANAHPQFDGIETEVIEQKGRIIKAVARVYRKDRSRPMTAEAYWDEYSKQYGNWKVMRRVMISKCAEAMALRKAFPQSLNAIYIEEELGVREQEEFDRDSVVNTPCEPRNHVFQKGRQKGHRIYDIAKAVGVRKLAQYVADEKARARISEYDAEQLEKFLSDPPPELMPAEPSAELTDDEKAEIVDAEHAAHVE